MPQTYDEFLTRRHFFGSAGVSLGSVALASLMADSRSMAAPAPPLNPIAPKKPHYPAKAKSVIFLFMAGAPSQLELFEPKPKLNELSGKPTPQSFIEGKRFAFLKGVPNLLGSVRKFAKYGQAGVDVSELLPNIAKAIDHFAVVKSLTTDVFNHGPAKILFNTGSPQFGRPSMGSWVTYGIGSESQSLPGFVVLQSGPRGPRGGASNWGSGFLPTSYQGVPFLPVGDPILNMANPPGVNANQQKHFFDGVREMNLSRLAETGDPEIATRIAAYEMAARMQLSAPELMNLAGETKETLAMYGAEPGKASFANNCLLARRLVERGVRFVQLYHTDWDHHGGLGANLGDSLDKVCKQVDQPTAALVRDLKQRGLLDSTLVIWGGEFGRTPMGETRESRQHIGRDHHIDAFTMLFAGGGVKGGQVIGKTDEIGYNVIEDKLHVHDVQATILHLLGLDHTKLTFRFQGRDFRLTDVHGHVIQKLLA